MIAQIDALETIYREPVDEAVGRLVGDAVLLDGHRERPGTVTCALGALAVHRDPGGPPELRVLVRPEQVALARDGAGVAARVRAREFRGAELAVTLELGDGEVVVSRLPGGADVALNEQVRLTVCGPVCVFPR